MYDYIRKQLFLANTGITAVKSVSSEFKNKVREVLPDPANKGNMSLNATVDPDIDTDVDGYYVTIQEAGRTDRKLVSTDQKEIELGLGQLTDVQEYTFKGGYDPPTYMVHRGGGNYFGTQTNFGKYVYGHQSGGENVSHISVCDRNDESIMVLVVYGDLDPDLTYAHSFPKQGKTDSNVLEDNEIGYAMHAAVKIRENRILGVRVIPDQPRGFQFTVIDEDCTVIEAYSVSVPEFDGAFNALFGQNENINLHSDGKGNVVLGFTATYSDYKASTINFHNISPFFMKSSDYGKTWDVVKLPGTNTLATIDNPVSDETNTNINPRATSGGVGFGYLSNSFIYDDVNEVFLLLSYGMESISSSPYGRFVLSSSKDLINWSSKQFPIFREANIDGTDSRDFDYNDGDEVYVPCAFERYGNKIICVATDLSEGAYTCVFENDSQKYGSRMGIIWQGYVDAGDVGQTINHMAMKKIDGVIYFASTFYDKSTTSLEPGFVVNALGLHTDITEETPYNGAMFGCIQHPSDVGWTTVASGTNSGTITNNGYQIITTSGVRYYSRYMDEIVVQGGRACKVKFKMKPVSGAQQYMRVRFPTTAASTCCDVGIFINTSGIYIYDYLAGSAIDSLSFSITDYINVYVAWRTTTTGSGSFAFYYSTERDADPDKWTGEEYTAQANGTITTPQLIFGSQMTSTTSQAIWKYVYWTNEIENTDFDYRYEDGNYVVGGWYPVGIPIQKELEDERTIDGLILNWKGLDAYEGDKFTVSSASEFPVDNLLQKYPNRIWRSADGTAASGYATDTEIIFDAQDSNIGKFVFDSYVLYGLNCNSIHVQADDSDPSGWGTPAYNDEFSTIRDYGYLFEDCYRYDQDIITAKVVMNFYEYDIGELVDEYIFLEKLTIPNTEEGDTVYKNIAFRIMDNDASYSVGATTKIVNITFSTKSIVDAFPETSSPGILTDGDGVSIHKKNIMKILDTVQEYRYIKITIDNPVSYATTYNMFNQFILPNERSWKMSCFDIGVRTQISTDADSGLSTTYNSNFALQEDIYGRIDLNQLNKKEKLRFSLQYGLMDDDDFDAIHSLVNTIHANGFKPFWFAPDVYDSGDFRTYDVYLVTVRTMSGNRFLPEHQSESLELEEVL